jgi:hypothetical protein
LRKEAQNNIGGDASDKAENSAEEGTDETADLGE